jgi:hypothetical protein
MTMRTFKTLKDLKQLKKDNPLQRIIRQCLKRTGHIEGYFVLIEEGDSWIDLPELQADINTLPFDGVFKVGKLYHAIYLTNNAFGLEFLIPDADWLNGTLKAHLEAHRH